MGSMRFCGCPYCEAVFRLSDDKFNHRAGMVRCGACREVFDANDNLVEKTSNKYKSITTNNEPKANADFGNSSEVENSDVGNANIVSPSREVFSQAVEEIETKTKLAGLDSDEDHSESSGLTGHDQFLLENTTRNPFEDHDSENPRIQNERSGESITHIDRGEFTQINEPSMEPLEYDPFQTIDISIEDKAEGKLDIDSPYLDSFDNPRSEKLEYGPDHFYDDKIDSMKIDTDTDYSTLVRVTRSGVDEYINDQTNPLFAIIWFFVVLGFVFLLGMQVKYFLVERYAQDETYRNYLVGFCKIAKCELSPRHDSFRFTLTHTKIDLHPTQPGALRVTVKLVNEADFPQPYPFLQLTLTDRVGRVVGRRTFSPGFYLPDGDTNMIGGGELGSILFDLARPHEKAVGFVVDIVTVPVAT